MLGIRVAPPTTTSSWRVRHFVLAPREGFAGSRFATCCFWAWVRPRGHRERYATRTHLELIVANACKPAVLRRLEYLARGS